MYERCWLGLDRRIKSESNELFRRQNWSEINVERSCYFNEVIDWLSNRADAAIQRSWNPGQYSLGAAYGFIWNVHLSTLNLPHVKKKVSRFVWKWRLFWTVILKLDSKVFSFSYWALWTCKTQQKEQPRFFCWAARMWRLIGIITSLLSFDAA